MVSKYTLINWNTNYLDVFYRISFVYSSYQCAQKSKNNEQVDTLGFFTYKTGAS